MKIKFHLIHMQAKNTFQCHQFHVHKVFTDVSLNPKQTPWTFSWKLVIEQCHVTLWDVMLHAGSAKCKIAMHKFMEYA